LKHENKILRARLSRQVHTTYEKRQTLLKFGKVIGRAIEELISIVSPSTFYNWVRNENGRPEPKNPKGGQRKPKELRELVLTIAEETGFGLIRIIGELCKLGITKISRQTVRNILKEHGIEPSPDRTSVCWADFLNRHGETLWGCDFFSVKSVTTKGIHDLYVLVFLCLQTREVIGRNGSPQRGTNGEAAMERVVQAAASGSPAPSPRFDFGVSPNCASRLRSVMIRMAARGMVSG
jgi:putative transposase